jgi:hypothetical protein
MKRLFCAAAIGSNVTYLNRKRTLPQPAAKGRFWPIPACSSRVGQMAASQDHGVGLVQFRFDAPVLRCF